MKIVIIGPAYPLRGGLATFDQRLNKAFLDEGHDCCIYSFSLQYPGFLFPGTTQYATGPAPENTKIFTVVNSVSPSNWLRVGRKLRAYAPDIIVVRYWIPFMGPALGTILRQAKKNGRTKVIAIADNVKPHEKRPGDAAFTRYFLKAVDACVVMSEKVLDDLRSVDAKKPAKLVTHPLYDNFGPIITRETALSVLRNKFRLDIAENDRVLLFFGFIRKYKGLDVLLRAMADARIRDSGIRLLVAGEFYEDAQGYRELIASLGLGDRLILNTDFIPDEAVPYFLCAADAVVQPYRAATQSGVTPLAYHFEKPMIVTSVGSLPAHVADGVTGIVCAPEDPAALATAILRFYGIGESYFIPNLRREKEKYSWNSLVNAIFGLSDDIQK